ncbi:MAG: peptidoglycan-binding protein LysM [Capnocytophaga sp.]|nr:peptidoglycan-binding protein LysM [Capnocytophaga sp.]
MKTKKRCLFTALCLLMFVCMCFTVKEEKIIGKRVHKNFVVEEPQLVTTTPAEEENESSERITLNPPLIGKSFIGFKEALAYRESRGNYFIVNQFGYMGKYQFGKSALQFYGVKNAEEFLRSPAQQERLFTLSVKRNKWVLRKEIDQFVGKQINGIQITESGILAAAHLAGAQNVKNYFRSRGNYAFADANGTTLQNYLKNFAGYDVEHIVPEQLPRF